MIACTKRLWRTTTRSSGVRAPNKEPGMRMWVNYAALVILLGCLAACGQAPQAAAPTPAPPPIPSPIRQAASTATPRAIDTSRTPSPSAAPTAAPIPMPTFLPEQRISITLNARRWWISQPVGVAPIATQGTGGILWIAFPFMRVVPPPIGTGDLQPLTAFFIMYTPLAGSGDDLGATGYRIATLPSDEDDMGRRLVSLSPLEQNRFLLVSYRQCRDCQNGGTLEFWRVDPAQYGQPESFVAVAELPGEGGGHFVAFASSPRWLIWNASDLNDPDSTSASQAHQVFLLDLHTGRRRAVALDAPYGVEQAQWNADGTFHLTMRQTHIQQRLDPAAGRIVRTAGP
jgi:hypothetical protein